MIEVVDMKKFIFLILIILTYNYYEVSKYKMNNVKFCSNKIYKKLKISQISDFHSSRFINLDKLVTDIYKYDPNLIVLTGDIIDGKKKEIDRALALVDKLRTLDLDIYFITGNHEYRNENFELFMEELSKRGIIILDNRLVELEEYNVSLAGINFGLSKEEYDETVSGMNVDSYNILLSHSPKYPVNYSENKEDLIICGHTHGGQVRVPFIGAVVSPSEGFFPKYDKGIYDLGKTKLYIDSGLGTSALALRMFNRAQISNIDIEVLK